MEFMGKKNYHLSPNIVIFTNANLCKQDKYVHTGVWFILSSYRENFSVCFN